MPTKIEWCDETINPIVGCSKISEGCRNCYAEKMAWRLKCMGIPKYQDVVDKNGWTGKIGIDIHGFNKVPKAIKAKKIFISSMGDLFYSGVSDKQIFETFDAMRHTHFLHHTWQILTKRPVRMSEVINKYDRHGLPCNIWPGVTVESSKYLHRIEELLQIRAAVRFVSVEPMLGEIDISQWLDPYRGLDYTYLNCIKNGLISKDQAEALKVPSIDWVIAGPETGPGKRKCKPVWIENLYEQCQAAGVPFFDKIKNNWLAREFPKNIS